MPEEPRAQRGAASSARSTRRSMAVERDEEERSEADFDEELPVGKQRVTRRSAPRVERQSGRVDLLDEPRRRWWRPESLWGRALLALAAFAAVGSTAVAVLLLHSALESDDRFRIVSANNIESTGLDEVTRGDLLPVFGEDIGKNIFFINLEARRREIEAIPWVKHATVMRMLPNRLRVSIEERRPVAFAQVNGETGLVDADGVLLSMSAAAMAERHYSFPEVTGVTSLQKPDERHVRMNVYMQMMKELDAGGQHNSLQISEVDLSDPDDARAKMVEQGGDVVAHFGYERFLDRYQRYMRHIGEWRQQYPHLIGVDMRYKGQVVLKMAPATAQAADAAAKPTDAQAAAVKAHPQAGAKAQAGSKAAGKQQATKKAHGNPKAPAKPSAKATPPGHGNAHAKVPPTHGAKPASAHAKNETQRLMQQKAAKQLPDSSHAEKQHRQETMRYPVNTARHTPPAIDPARPAVEGQ